jgi:hypothetical protein
MDYEIQVYQALDHVAKAHGGFDVEYEKSLKSSRFDIVVGKDQIAFEIKVIQSIS